MVQNIIIDSLPTPINGICNVDSGNPITFFIASGITGNTVSYDWYLNDAYVSTGTQYVLLAPSSDDEIYVKAFNCRSNGLSIGDWVEDIDFYYNDIVTSTSQVYNIDLKASFNYKILSIVLHSDSTINNVEVKINNTNILWFGSTVFINVDTNINETLSLSLNDVSTDDLITLHTNGIDGGATLLEGKIKIKRLNNFTTPTI